MAMRSFDALYDQFSIHFRAQEWAQGLELLDREAGRFPEQAAHLYYLRACLAARLNQPERACGLLAEALQVRIWYAETLLRQSPSFHPLQGRPDFEQLVAENGSLLAELREERVQEVQFPDKNATPFPLLLALHGNGSSVATERSAWMPAVNLGWALAMPQSSQALWQNGYFWTTHDLAAQEITSFAAGLRQDDAIDGGRVILGGFSMGGEVAIRLALSGEVESCGFVAVGPGGPLLDEPSLWGPLIDQGLGRGLMGVILMSERDTAISHEGIRTLVSMLNTAGIPCKLLLSRRWGHVYPPDFDCQLAKALNLLVSGE